MDTRMLTVHAALSPYIAVFWTVKDTIPSDNACRLMIVGTSQVFGKEGVKPINVVISLVEKSQWETAKLQVQAIQKSLKDDEVGDIELVMGGVLCCFGHRRSKSHQGKRGAENQNLSGDQHRVSYE